MKRTTLFYYDLNKIRRSSVATWASLENTLVGSQRENAGCLPVPTQHRAGLKHPKINAALAGALVEQVNPTRRLQQGAGDGAPGARW